MNQKNITYDKLMEIIELQTEVVQQGTDLSSIINLVVERAQVMCNADGACIELLVNSELVYGAVSGLAKRFLGLRLNADNSLSGECVKVGEILVSNDIEIDSRVNKEACRKVGLSSMIVVPLSYRNNVVGVLKVLSAQTNYFHEEYIKILDLVSALIGAAMFSALKNEESEIFYKATHDYLTGISNRSFYYDRLRQRLLQAKKNGDMFGVIIMDMDGLKEINDNYGHRTGDAAIKEVTIRIKPLLGESDTLSRLGGDEFGIIVSNMDDCECLVTIIESIQVEISKPFTFEEHNLKLGISAGYSIFQKDGVDIEELIEKADHSMYESKRIRKGNIGVR